MTITAKVNSYNHINYFGNVPQINVLGHYFLPIIAHYCLSTNSPLQDELESIVTGNGLSFSRIKFTVVPAYVRDDSIKLH